jgi:DNA-binding response OmpR family regulator
MLGTQRGYGAEMTADQPPITAIGSILIVDHEPTIVDLLVEILTDEGYIAYTAPDGAGALVAIARHPPALILLDAGRPGPRGGELIEEMRQAGLATIPMVLMTTAQHDAAPPLVLGAVECLAKPFDLDELLACIARYVQPAQTEEPSACYALYPTAAA